jgi:hypothetical protein
LFEGLFFVLFFYSGLGRFSGPIYDLAFFQEAHVEHVEQERVEETIDGESLGSFFSFFCFFGSSLLLSQGIVYECSIPNVQPEPEAAEDEGSAEQKGQSKVSACFFFFVISFFFVI